MNRQACSSWALETAIILLAFVVGYVIIYYVVYHGKSVDVQPVDPRVARLQDKLDAINILNAERNKTQPPAPPVDLIQLNTPEWRVKAVKQRISPYDAVGRHPLYWYTKVDGGLYAMEEVIVWRVYYRLHPESSIEPLKKTSFSEGAELALGRKRDAMLNPCYNYVDMEATVVVEWIGPPEPRYKNVWKVYIFYLVGKWVDWVSLPLYADGRFAAEGYADPAMKPVAFVVRYTPHVNPRHHRESYSLGNIYYCKYLDPLADCKDAAELNGTFVVRKVLDDGRWYIKIDTSVQLNRTGLYTFEIVAENLRAQGKKCPLMHYTVEIPRR
jgi:hypothetical protein